MPDAADRSPATPSLPADPQPDGVVVRTSAAKLLPLACVWAAALSPVAFYVLQQSDPQLAVRLAMHAKRFGEQALMIGGLLALLGIVLFPPFPAWIRRFVDRVRTSWSIDRAPLLRALSELQHLETAQKHFEVAKLAWIRTDLELVAPHAIRAVELDPSMPHAHHLLGLFLLRKGAVPSALLAFQQAEALDPGHAFGASLLHVARTQYLLGHHAEALAAFEQHARQHGGSQRSNYWLGEARLANGQRDAAASAFQTAAADPKVRLTAEENWFRALARVRSWRFGGTK